MHILGASACARVPVNEDPQFTAETALNKHCLPKPNLSTQWKKTANVLLQLPMQWSSPRSLGQLFQTIQLQFCQHLCLQSSHQRTPEYFCEGNKSDNRCECNKQPSFSKSKVVRNYFWLVYINSTLQFLRVLFERNPFRTTKIRFCRKLFENWCLYVFILTAFNGSVGPLHLKFENGVQEVFFPTQVSLQSWMEKMKYGSKEEQQCYSHMAENNKEL